MIRNSLIRCLRLLLPATAMMAAAAGLRAQELSAPLVTFKEICLQERACVAARDLDGLDRCATSFRKLKILTLDKQNLRPDDEDNPDLAGHLQFTAQYVDSLLLFELDQMKIKSDIHIVNRDVANSYDVLVCHKRIPARSSRCFRFRGYDEQEFLVVASDTCSDLRLQVIHEPTGTHYVSPRSDDGCQAFKWNMGPTYSECTLVIENLSDEDAVCAIASN